MTTETMKFKRGDVLEYAPDAHLGFKVSVLDSRMSYGVEQYLIAPQEGTGSKWVNASSLIRMAVSR